MVVTACINRPVVGRVAGLAVGDHGQISMTLLTVASGSDVIVVEGTGLTRVTGLAIVVLARQTAGVAAGTGQAIGGADDVMVLGRSGAGTTGAVPEDAVMAA